MDYEIGIVGAGFAGLTAALRLKKSGRSSFVIFERAGIIGGTWRDNIYPGCACDVPSLLYCFADEPNHNWSRLYAGQAEILEYIKAVVQKNDLDKHIRVNTKIVEAVFQKNTGTWRLKDANGNAVVVRMLILATGLLNRPNIPDFPGLNQFIGKQFHSSRWDPEYDLRGKKVAIIGTGASAIQITPSISSMAKELMVFQRTPAWVIPRKDRIISRRAQLLWKRLPSLLKMQREAFYWVNELSGLGFLGNGLVNGIMLRMASRRLKEQVSDPELRKRLTPSYKIGCKRILSSDDYYPVFNSPHVQLITGCIEKFVPEGIVAEGITYPADVIIHATGFTAADVNSGTTVTGLHGKDLVEKWKLSGAEAYLGTTIAGFPNLAFVLGPNTGLGFNSVLHMMESQMNYVLGYIKHLEGAGNGSYLDLDQKVQEQYNEKLQKRFTGTVWSSGCNSWYLNIAGKNTTIFPGLSTKFRQMTNRFHPSPYTLHTGVSLSRRPGRG